jgi:hypothetical protein
MSDCIDDMKALKAYHKREKETLGELNRRLLAESGLEHSSKDPFDTHYHVKLLSGLTVSFWPTSGKWRPHTAGARTSEGLDSLLQFNEDSKGLRY